MLGDPEPSRPASARQVLRAGRRPVRRCIGGPPGSPCPLNAHGDPAAPGPQAGAPHSALPRVRRLNPRILVNACEVFLGLLSERGRLTERKSETRSLRSGRRWPYLPEPGARTLAPPTRGDPDAWPRGHLGGNPAAARKLCGGNLISSAFISLSFPAVFLAAPLRSLGRLRTGVRQEHWQRRSTTSRSARRLLERPQREAKNQPPPTGNPFPLSQGHATITPSSIPHHEGPSKRTYGHLRPRVKALSIPSCKQPPLGHL